MKRTLITFLFLVIAGTDGPAVAESIGLSTDKAACLSQILYQRFLHRSAEPDGLRYWTDRLQHTPELSREVLGFIDNREFFNLQGRILALHVAFSLPLEQSEYAKLAKELNARRIDSQDIAQRILELPELREQFAHLGNSEFVLSVYRLIVGAVPATAVEHHVYAAGLGRAFAVTQIVGSEAVKARLHARVLLQGLFLGVAQKMADPKELETLEEKLASGATSYEIIVKDLLQENRQALAEETENCVARMNKPGIKEHPLLPHAPTETAICTGLENSSYGTFWEFTERGCISGSAYYSITEPAYRRGDSVATAAIAGSCCQLPENDILISDETLVAESCPENYVVTGYLDRAACADCEQRLRCTKINSVRYQLGPPNEGVYWGTGFSYYKHQKRLMKSEIPAAIRLSVGRTSPYTWDRDGCIGYPFGSLLVSRRGRRCHNITFRQLQYSGSQGDPERGTPVSMFPECKSIAKPFSLNASCVR